MAYYCIVNLPGAPVRDIVALDAHDDAAARRGLAALVSRWPGHETILLYDGERLVEVVANPSLGFVSAPLDLSTLAA